MPGPPPDPPPAPHMELARGGGRTTKPQPPGPLPTAPSPIQLKIPNIGVNTPKKRGAVVGRFGGVSLGGPLASTGLNLVPAWRIRRMGPALALPGGREGEGRGACQHGNIYLFFFFN